MKVGDKSYLYDALQANAGVMQQLQAILEDSNVVKVMVDCRNDSAALMHQKGIEIRNIFDLQVNLSHVSYNVRSLAVCPSFYVYPQVADGLVGLRKGVYGQQHSRDTVGLQKLLAKYNMPLSASKAGADWLSPHPLLNPHCNPVVFARAYKAIGWPLSLQITAL